ncbi:hypothetical protein C2E23DRAFT_836503 [Lenzites betulinus]|nr:hypothetical protein C2E23DRAFT_836503 [Lenzites betulinus]
MTQSSLIGSILERKTTAKPSAPTQTTSKTGFPAVQHRSQSAFARSLRDGQKPAAQRLREAPVVQSASSTKPPVAQSTLSSVGNKDDWRVQMEEENRRRVEGMTEEEREQERAEILEKFGSNVAETLQRAREVREGKRRETESPSQEVGVSPSPSSSPPSQSRIGERTRSYTNLFTPSPPTSAHSSRPPSRSERKIRFADVTADDVHVYESAPPSPRKRAIALPAPSDSDGPTVSMGQWRSRNAITPMTPLRSTTDVSDDLVGEQKGTKVRDLEEGTPEDIRQRFFPAASASNSSLAWLQDKSEQDTELEAEPSVRFDLTGTPIPSQLSSKLPTHLGLHHHAEGSHAGYTLEDIFLLSRSTVPAQRASMIGVLAKIAHKLARTSVDSKKGIPELAGQELTLRKRLLATGVEAMAERGSVGARAVELLWECTTSWDDGVQLLDNVELRDLDLGTSPSSSEGALSSLPLDYMLPQIATTFGTADLPPESMVQLLEVLHRVAQHSNGNAASIVSTKGLIANTFQTFLLTPIPPVAGSALPKPFALTFLRTLALSSRENAVALVDPADSLLRFIINLPSASPFPPSLAASLLTETLRLYAALGSYGLYSHIATTAQEHLIQLNRYVVSSACQSNDLRCAWLQLLEAWTICAQDPHRTTPSHGILWSQVCGWGWAEDIIALRSHLTRWSEDIWAHLWNAGSAYLEGARVNGTKGGEEERSAILSAVKDAFSDGVEKRVVDHAIRGARDALSHLSAGLRQAILPGDIPTLQRLGRHANSLAAAIRFFLSCTSHSPSDSIPDPPFFLPFADLSALCATMTNHPLWTCLYTPESVSFTHTLYRPFSTLLAWYLQLSRRMPGNPPDLWMAQALAILCRLFPGEEEFVQRAIGNITETVTADFLQARDWSTPKEVWDQGGMSIVSPFLVHSVRPKAGFDVGPTCITPRSISTATTHRLPPLSALSPNERRDYPLPLTKDWLFCPLDHLLRSGESEVFRSLPDSWDGSEVDVVRATVLLARVSQEVLQFYNLPRFLMSREEVAFGCMKVFMLEHGQQQSTSQEEVFRDTIVERFMTDLLAPFSASASENTLRTPPPSIHSSDSIDVVAKRLLGSAVPFYQWYTDFVGLYDSISFAHPLFARLLLPPLSMRYPMDYRKYLWADYNHVIRTIHVTPEGVITGSIAEYLWPVETDADVIGAYLRALVKSPLDGFVRLIAVHHIACRIWTDLGADGEDKAAKLLQAVVAQGAHDVVRDIVLYRQNRQGNILLPPACFEQQGDWKVARLEFAEKSDGGVGERLKGLLQSE